MTTPVEVACDTLRSDATKWGTASDAMETAARTSEGLVLGSDKLGVAAQERGVIAAYDALKQKLSGLITGGATEFDALSSTLREVADTYQREDAEGAHTITEAGG
ncbi:MAG TPA: type VII secretion target [Actinophytocola sp.]|uniref:type VII secretion target n=1 Tax=Actinophytocola sp. TaxID=1872138 RepID=UPI002DBF506C|nr:type VII secretion target [Actinophytocola sp.]HEU5471465.1 type VII secretion target [Actinophytocola sp.]